jgi:hypothetical protein
MVQEAIPSYILPGTEGREKVRGGGAKLRARKENDGNECVHY